MVLIIKAQSGGPAGMKLWINSAAWMPVCGREAATTSSLHPSLSPSFPPLPWMNLQALYLALLWKGFLTTNRKRAQKPREEMALVPRLSPMCSETSSWCFRLWWCAGACLSSVSSHVCPSQQGHGLFSSIPLPFALFSLKLVPASINAVKKRKRKVKYLRAVGLKTVGKDLDSLKGRKQQFPFISNSRVMCPQSHVSAGKYLRSIKSQPRVSLK